MDCGHRWPTTDIRAYCPKCRVKFDKSTENKKRTDYSENYLNIITAVKEFQVVRSIFIMKNCKVGEPAFYIVKEVVQHWISKHGKHVVRSVGKSPFGHYRRDPWYSGSDLTIRHAIYDNSYYLWGVDYPYRRILPELIRNGYCCETYKLHFAYFTSILLSDPHAETLLKNGYQHILFQNYCQHKKNIKKYWNQIKICMRNKYTIHPHLWFDYLRYLEFFNRDINNAFYICPRDLRKEHDRLMNKIDEIRKRERMIQQHQHHIQICNEYIKEKERFFNINIVHEDISITPLKSIDEFIEDQKKHNICIYSSDYHTKNDSLILRAKRKNRYLATIEFSLEKMEVIQCRGSSNSTPRCYNELVSLVNSKKRLINKCKKAIA